MIDLKEEFKEKQFFLLHGDCLEQMKSLPDNSVDSIVTDPPYGLSFMGKKWDYDVPSTEIWQEALRILKPGGHLLAFAGTRTQHRMAVRIEDAGFEIRDMIAWVYGSGFPKSMDVSKAIDATILTGGSHSRNLKQAISQRPGESRATATLPNNGIISGDRRTGVTNDNSSTDEAKQWDGWGTALKPALEPITVARKPLIGTVASNVLAYGTGTINIDACRIDVTEDGGRPLRIVAPLNSEIMYAGNSIAGRLDGSLQTSKAVGETTQGRFPANLITDGSEEVVAMFPDSNGAGKSLPQVKITGYGDKNTGTGTSEYFGGDRIPFDAGSGSAARFFKQCKYESGDFDIIKYCAKTSKKERNSGCEGVMSWENVDRPRLMGILSEHQKVMSENMTHLLDDTEWSMLWCGSQHMDKCLSVIKCITLMVSKMITESKTSKSLQHLNISDFILDVTEIVRESGLNLVSIVEYINQLKLSITQERLELVQNVNHALFQELLEISNLGKLGNIHSTVKPQELMRYLCQLITPPNGIILDPFNGSGSTGKAAVSLGYKYIGCELDENYVKISNARIQHAIDNKYIVKKTQKSKVIVPETSILDDLFE